MTFTGAMTRENVFGKVFASLFFWKICGKNGVVRSKDCAVRKKRRFVCKINGLVRSNDAAVRDFEGVASDFDRSVRGIVRSAG